MAVFDLARAYSAAEGIKGAQQEQQLRGLQIEGAQLELDKARQKPKLTYEQLFQNTQMMHAASTAVAADPAMATYWEKQLLDAGLIQPGASFSGLPPGQLQDFAGRMSKETGSVLAALDPKTYGPDYTDAMKAFVEQGGDPRDTSKFNAFKDAEQARKDATAIRGQNISAETARSGQAVTMRGQDIAASTSRANAELAARTAAAKGAAGGQPTGEERKNAYLATRLQGALTKLNEIDAKNPDAAKPGYWEKIAGDTPLLGNETAANLARGSARRQAHTAQLDALDAALTLGTGAAYTKEQLAGYAVSYFPQIGDDDAVIADKKERFTNLVDAARAAAGRAAPNIDTALGNAPQTAAPVTKTAPPAAIQYLQQHPEFSDAFMEKYGFLP